MSTAWIKYFEGMFEGTSDYIFEGILKVFLDSKWFWIQSEAILKIRCKYFEVGEDSVFGKLITFEMNIF